MSRPNVLLALLDPAEPYIEALSAEGFMPVSYLDEETSLQATDIDLAVLDADLPLNELRAMRVQLPASARVLVLLGEGEMPTGLVETGDDIALKPLDRETLSYRLQALLIRAGGELPASADWAQSEQALDNSLAGVGRIISIFAPKGGVGKTTIAVNMSVALREQTQSPVLLFDADIGVGNVTAILDVPYSMGLADLADSPESEWTPEVFAQLISTHADSGLSVLAWGNNPSQSARITTDLMLAALRWAAANYSYVIIDNHPGYDDRTMAMLAVAQDIFLVVTPEVGPIRNSSQFVTIATEMGLRDNLSLIVNRANCGISSADISASLGLSIAASIESNGPKSTLASNEGRPIISKYPREKISADLRSVAALVMDTSAPEPAVNWLSRLVGHKAAR